jgi:hypothetical protein
MTDALMAEAAAEIARIQAEVERLTEERDYWISRAHEAGDTAELLDDYADHLEADRAALATRVAEAVRREGVGRVLHAETIGAAIENLHAMNLRPIVAAALKESAP